MELISAPGSSRPPSSLASAAYDRIEARATAFMAQRRGYRATFFNYRRKLLGRPVKTVQ
jgi:hypothetical protein